MHTVPTTTHSCDWILVGHQRLSHQEPITRQHTATRTAACLICAKPGGPGRGRHQRPPGWAPIVRMIAATTRQVLVRIPRAEKETLLANNNGRPVVPCPAVRLMSPASKGFRTCREFICKRLPGSKHFWQQTVYLQRTSEGPRGEGCRPKPPERQDPQEGSAQAVRGGRRRATV